MAAGPRKRAPAVKTITKLEDLTPDPRNPNRGTERGVSIVEKSIEQLGAARSIVASSDGVVGAGNKTLQAAVEKGLRVRVVQTRGDELVVVQRVDLSSDDPRFEQLKIADNRASEVGLEWDPGVLAAMVNDGVKLDDFISNDELKVILGSKDAPADFPDVDPKAKHECPKCHFRFD